MPHECPGMVVAFDPMIRDEHDGVARQLRDARRRLAAHGDDDSVVRAHAPQSTGSFRRGCASLGGYARFRARRDIPTLPLIWAWTQFCWLSVATTSARGSKTMAP